MIILFNILIVLALLIGLGSLIGLSWSMPSGDFKKVWKALGDACRESK